MRRKSDSWVIPARGVEGQEQVYSEGTLLQGHLPTVYTLLPTLPWYTPSSLPCLVHTLLPWVHHAALGTPSTPGSLREVLGHL